MNDDFLSKIKKKMRVSLFNNSDLKLIFSDKEVSAIHNSLTYHLKAKNLVRHKRDLYSLAPDRDGRYPFSKFALANKLVTHSFISFESALSHHGLIPEAVYETTSATFVKNKIFENSLGIFSYQYTPVDPFYLDVVKDEVTGVKVANPVRALFDLIYARRKHYADVKDLESDFRIDLEELKVILNKIDQNDIYKLGELYKKNSTRTLALILIRDLK